MYPFFQLVERAGIRQSRIAKLMDCSEGYLSRVKTGTKIPSPRFQQRAAQTLLTIGIRQPNGQPYEPADLFFAQSFNRLNETNIRPIDQEAEHGVIAIA